MNMKKVYILITFLAVSLMAGRAFACDMHTGCAPYISGMNQPYFNNPVMPAYQPALPQTYNQGDVAANTPQIYVPQVVTTQPTVTQIALAPQPVAPAYLPVSPTIFNNNGTTTAQNTGVVSGTPTNTSGSGTSNTGSENESIFGNLFGTKKSTTFSNGTSDGVNTDANLRALVNSKGLAMGSDGLACGVNNGQYLVLYKNITNQALTNAAIRISLPDGVSPTQTSTGSYSERDNTLTYFIGSLAPNQEGQILVPVKTTGTVSGVARSEFVYTYPNQVQDMVVSYAFGNSSCVNTNNALGASAIGSGSGFFGGTLLGWLFLALLVSAFIYLVRFFLIRKEAHAAHGHAEAH